MCTKKEVFAHLEIEVKDDCPESPGIMNVQTEPNSTISSARYPSPFPPKQEECWMRTPSCGHFVHLEFAEFDVNLHYPLLHDKSSLLTGSGQRCLFNIISPYQWPNSFFWEQIQLCRVTPQDYGLPTWPCGQNVLLQRVSNKWSQGF